MTESDAGEFADCNHTELVAMARECNLEAHAGLERNHLISIITGGPEPLPKRKINKIRLNIMRFVNDHWDQVSPLISCPAKSRDEYACYNCTDLQVITCAIDNADKIEET